MSSNTLISIILRANDYILLRSVQARFGIVHKILHLYERFTDLLATIDFSSSTDQVVAFKKLF